MMSCTGKDSEAESRSRDHFAVFSFRGAGRGGAGGPRGAGVPHTFSPRMVIFETLHCLRILRNTRSFTNISECLILFDIIS